jgi:hypothetical protein
MADVLSNEQALARAIRDMGAELGPFYHNLSNEVAWLHAKWRQYRQLYAHSPERVAFLNKIAGHLFSMIQGPPGGMYDDVLLHLARLTDRRGNTLRLQILPKLVPHALASDVRRLVQAAEAACGSAMSSRNERIAHMDLSRARDGTFEPPPSRAEIEAALTAIRAVLNRLESHYWQSPTAYEHFAAAGGADSLLHYLRRGHRAEERRMERLLQGKPLPEDLEPEVGACGEGSPARAPATPP